jgi:hypothetical protein
LLSKKHADDEANASPAFAIGTFVEFEEKNRVHIGKISHQEHKSNGSTLYKVTDNTGKTYAHIPDKAVHFAMHPPNTPGAASKLFDDFLSAYELSEEDICAQLEVSPELLELAWEETSEEDDLTPDKLIELVHSHAASAIEKYMAWKLLQTDTAHVFFKVIKDHGRVVSFRAKARKAVEAAKLAFCITHNDSDLCLVS